MATAVSQYSICKFLFHTISLTLAIQKSKSRRGQTNDPEQLFTKQERIGSGNFGEVFKGYVEIVSTVLASTITQSDI